MTKSTITDERITSVIERMEHFASNLKWTDVRGAQDLLTAADGLRELQERRKADSEPVAYWRKAIRSDGICYADGINSKRFHDANPPFPLEDGDYWEIIPLYRHAQPAPVVPEEATPDSIEILASARRRDRAVFQWDEDQRNAAADSWNACRAAMLDNCATVESRNNAGCSPKNGLKCATVLQAEPVTTACKLGNSPVIPDGYVMVPKEPTEAMMLHKSGCQHHAWDDPDCAMRQTRRLIWSHMLAAAPQEVK